MKKSQYVHSVDCVCKEELNLMLMKGYSRCGGFELVEIMWEEQIVEPPIHYMMITIFLENPENVTITHVNINFWM